MKVILTDDVAGTGVKGDIKEVAPGFARNFLFARDLAQVATPEAVKQAEEAKAAATAKAAEIREALAGSLKKLNGQTVVITAKATEEGHLFAGISADKVAAAIKEQKEIEIPAENVAIAEPLKGVGSHEVELKAADLSAKITIEIKAEA